PWVDAYWNACDPDYLDGPDAESFRTFAARLSGFHRRLRALDGTLVIAVAHGQFFSGYLLGLERGFQPTTRCIRDYRKGETARPMANCEVIELGRDVFN